MKTIWKYKIEPPFSVITMPRDAEVISLQIQNGAPYLWAVVETNNPTIERVFKTFCTGEPIVDFDGLKSFIGTYQLNGYVFHVFEDDPLKEIHL